jgi:hypothetical protein
VAQLLLMYLLGYKQKLIRLYYRRPSNGRFN